MAEAPAAPQASVILVGYNSREHLARCLPSLLRSRGAFEVLVVDNASADGTAALVREAFPAVQLVCNAANLGFGAAANAGARRARGEVLAFLNPDTEVDPGWLEALLAALAADPSAGLATSRVLFLRRPDRVNTCGNQVHVTGLTLCRGLGQPRAAFDRAAEVAAVSGAAFAVRRALFEQLGGFDPLFFLYVEDTDLSWRARLAGHRCVYVPGSIVYHDYALRFGPDKTFYQERNRHLMLLKSWRARTLLLLLPALLLGEAVTWGYVLLREPRRAANKLRACAWLVRHAPQVLARRRQVQRTRRVRDRDLLAATTHRLEFEQAGGGWLPRLAHLAFDPLFFLSRRLALALMGW